MSFMCRAGCAAVPGKTHQAGNYTRSGPGVNQVSAPARIPNLRPGVAPHSAPDQATASPPVAFGSFAELGYPHYAGALTWRAIVAAPSGGAGWRLRADTGGAVASARFCGVELGARAWAPFEWDIPPEFAGQAGELEITVFSSAQPMFGPYDAPGAAWDCCLWFGDHAPGAACGLFRAEWIRR